MAMGRSWFLFSFLLYASSSFAQRATIDSMVVDEDSSFLELYGHFGFWLGTVTVNGDTLPVNRWSDSAVVTSIPDTGFGSAGPVVVSSQGFSSDTSLLTSITCSYQQSGGYQDIGITTYSGYQLHFSFRVDLNMALRPGDAFQGSKTSWIRAFENDGIGHPSSSVLSEYDVMDTTIFARNKDGSGFNCLIAPADKKGRTWYFALSNLPQVNVQVQQFLNDGTQKQYSYSRSIDNTYGTIYLDSLFNVSSITSGLPEAPTPEYYGNYAGTIQSGRTLFPPIDSGNNVSSVDYRNNESDPWLQVTITAIQYKTNSSAELFVYNLIGEEVAHFRCEPGNTTQNIPLMQLPLTQGIYFALLKSKNQNAVVQFSLHK